jgi:transcriptional regulator with XRE-family HTH domain
MELEKDEKIIFIRIGHKLKKLREESKYTSYEDFAMYNDLSRRYYWEVEKGKSISLRYLIKILKIHNISLKEFFKDFD